MDDIENIIKRYQQELLEFSFQSKSESPQIISAITTNIEQEPVEQSITEDPQPVAEQPAIAALPYYSTYEDFLAANTERGSLRVQVFGGNQFFPISGARVTVSVPLAQGDEVRQFDAITDINGVVDNIYLPAPPLSLSQAPNTSQQRPFSYYTVNVEHPRYASSRFVNVPVFSDVKSIQNVQLVPLVGTGETPDTTVQFQTEPFLKLRGSTDNGSSNRS